MIEKLLDFVLSWLFALSICICVPMLLLERSKWHDRQKDIHKTAQQYKIERLENEISEHQNNLETLLSSKLDAMPWLAGMIADYVTYDIEAKAKYLDWGSDKKRLKKVDDIRDIRADAKARIAEATVAKYQLEYLKQLYPALEDVLVSEYEDFPSAIGSEPPEYDYTRDYLSKEEYAALSEVEKNQLALDRYVASHQKSKWQIGRDYEMAVAYEYRKKGYTVDSFGTYKGLEDLGRDIIAQKGSTVLIIQCKYWAQEKTIHEKHIFQLYGTSITYKIEHPDMLLSVKPVFITNIKLSPMAKDVAKMLDITVVENHAMVDFPRIKCNIGRGENGRQTKIYHLPMDMQYDIIRLKDSGEFYAFTVQEAVDAGFRRAYKWHGSAVK